MPGARKLFASHFQYCHRWSIGDQSIRNPGRADHYAFRRGNTYAGDTFSPGGKLLPGYDFVSADSNGGFLAANDGNGRDADASDPGDWVNSTDKQNALFSDCDTKPSSWHGTTACTAASPRRMGTAPGSRKFWACTWLHENETSTSAGGTRPMRVVLRSSSKT